VKKVIELIRVSTEGQADEDRASIPAQRTINRRTAQTYGLTIVGSIELINVSGAAVLKTPEMQQLLKRIESPDIQGVVVREFSRVMRPDQFADFVLLQAFQETGTVLYLPDGPLDLRSKSGRLMGMIRAAIAGNERTEILERVWGAKEEKRKAGKLAQSAIVLPHAVGYSEQRGFFYKPEAERVGEAFRLFLNGEHNYSKLAEIVGVTPRGMHLIMRNPIWTGWRVIDKKRDTASASRPSKDGRQGDRRKIMRAPEDIIRTKVIAEPLVSEAEFQRVQGIMDQKSKLHWRSRPDTRHSFIYNGFLICGACGDLIYGHVRRDPYYLCKRRYWPNGKRGVTLSCEAPTMRADRLEPTLDSVFSERLTDRGYLTAMIEQLEQRRNGNGNKSKIKRLESEIARLAEKKQRVMDGYFEGLIRREEMDRRAMDIDKNIAATNEILSREGHSAPMLTVKELAAIVRPLYRWKAQDREAKRNFLSAVVPEIHVHDYTVRGISLAAPVTSLSCGDNGSRTAMDSLVAASEKARIYFTLPDAA
jgi:DNA invertase Pin-like site-specific DNA recombinase